MRPYSPDQKKRVVDAVLSLTLTQRDNIGVVTFKGNEQRFGYEFVHEQILKLSDPTLNAVLAALGRTRDNAVLELVCHLLNMRAATSSTKAENISFDRIIYYGSRLASTLVEFTYNDAERNSRCLAAVTTLESSARMFNGTDDKEFRSGNLRAERAMKARAAWFCLGSKKIKDAETLEFMITNLERLVPYAADIRKRQYFDVELLQQMLDVDSPLAEGAL